ncbi:hypothetical protein Taro_054754 [Colocasia esculenta]|uniref:Uncharacterized protein n=1 Tax=Colocasia esculenta TaxID=4460 RepID=A0A843XRL2_COLES|nr:hypothetical protein [Colocasia esculenta]
MTGDSGLCGVVCLHGSCLVEVERQLDLSSVAARLRGVLVLFVRVKVSRRILVPPLVPASARLREAVSCRVLIGLMGLNSEDRYKCSLVWHQRKLQSEIERERRGVRRCVPGNHRRTRVRAERSGTAELSAEAARSDLGQRSFGDGALELWWRRIVQTSWGGADQWQGPGWLASRPALDPGAAGGVRPGVLGDAAQVRSRKGARRWSMCTGCWAWCERQGGWQWRPAEVALVLVLCRLRWVRSDACRRHGGVGRGAGSMCAGRPVVQDRSWAALGFWVRWRPGKLGWRDGMRSG